MRRLLLGIAAIALVPSEAAAAPGCQTSQKTLMASSQVRVFRSDGRTFACWVEGRRVRSLAGAQLLAVATRWVAPKSRSSTGAGSLRGSSRPRRPDRVVARARTGTRIVFGEDPRIHPRSLALARSHVYWSVDGRPRTARLP